MVKEEIIKTDSNIEFDLRNMDHEITINLEILIVEKTFYRQIHISIRNFKQKLFFIQQWIYRS